MTVIDLVSWGLIAMIGQIAVYVMVRLIIPNLSQRIAAGRNSRAALFSGCDLARSRNPQRLRGMTSDMKPRR